MHVNSYSLCVQNKYNSLQMIHHCDLPLCLPHAQTWLHTYLPVWRELGTKSQSRKHFVTEDETMTTDWEHYFNFSCHVKATRLPRFHRNIASLKGNKQRAGKKVMQQGETVIEFFLSQTFTICQRFQEIPFSFWRLLQRCSSIYIFKKNKTVANKTCSVWQIKKYFVRRQRKPTCK